MKSVFRKQLFLSCAFCIASSIVSTAKAQYNLPRYSKVSVVRSPGEVSYMELKLHWSSEKPPNFPSTLAVEFEVHIDNKCFVQPKGGKDLETDCNRLLINHNFPTEVTPFTGGEANCYVDVLNYWAPDMFNIGSYIQDQCGYINPRTMDCLSTLAAFGEVTDKEGNFAVGLHDASVLENGEVELDYCKGLLNSESPNLLSQTSVFDLASITKLYTTAIILQLYEKGDLDLEDRVSNFLNNFKSSEIKISDLLTHHVKFDLMLSEYRKKWGLSFPIGPIWDGIIRAILHNSAGLLTL